MTKDQKDQPTNQPSSNTHKEDAMAVKDQEAKQKLAEATQLLRNEQQLRIKQCEIEVNAVLQKYGCRLQTTTTIGVTR